DRQAALDNDPATGLAVFYAGQPTYRQPSADNRPADECMDGPETPTPADCAAPCAYDELTQTPATWDSGSDSASSTGRNGDFIELVLGVDENFAGGGGQASLPNLLLSYTES